MAESVEGIKTVVVARNDRSKNTIISTKKTAPEDDHSYYLYWCIWQHS